MKAHGNDLLSLTFIVLLNTRVIQLCCGPAEKRVGHSSSCEDVKVITFVPNTHTHINFRFVLKTNFDFLFFYKNLI